MPDIYENSIYKDVLEAQVIRSIHAKLGDLFFYELDQLQKNQFMMSAGTDGLAEAEAMFQIIPDLSADDLSFRKQRVINRNSTKPPYTFRYLRGKLDQLFGAGNYILRREPSERTLYIESAAENSGWYTEVSLTVNSLKPANLIYINNPYVAKQIGVSEAVHAADCLRNYVAGAWRLGQSPFLSERSESMIKTMETNSISRDYLAAIALESVSRIAKARLNGTVEITDFAVKTSEENECTVEYLVRPEQAGEISKLELLDENNAALTSSAVYVPVDDLVRIKHKFLIKEG